MIIKGNTVGTTMPRSDWGQTNPKSADYIKGKEIVDEAIQKAQRAAEVAQATANNALPKSRLLIIGDTAPTAGPCLWFNTAQGGAGNEPSLLSLDDDETGYDVQAVVGDETYGVNNATVNQGATSGTYDFTVL